MPDAAPAPDAAPRPPAPRPNAGLTWPARIRRTLWFPDDQLGWIPSAVMASGGRTPGTAGGAALELLAGQRARRGSDRLATARHPVGRRLPRSVGREPRRPRDGPHRRLAAPHAGGLDHPDGRSRDVRHAEPARRLRPPLPRARRPVLGHRERLRPGGAAAAAGARQRARRRPPPGVRRSLYRPAELATFLDGVAALLDRRPEVATRLRVEFIGSATDACKAVAASRLARADVASVVTFTPFLPAPRPFAGWPAPTPR